MEKELPSYYRYTAKGWLSDISLKARTRIFKFFMDELIPLPDEKVLDVGATSDMSRPESNFFEHMYPFKNRVTAAGVEDVALLKDRLPDVSFVRIKPGEPLPFADEEFDLAFSNATLEHVGDAGRRKAFVRELTRVSRRGLIAVPDRSFPVEHHTCLPFLHWLPREVHWTLLRWFGFPELASVDSLNVLGEKDLRESFGPEITIQIKRVRLFGFSSNLVALYWKKKT